MDLGQIDMLGKGVLPRGPGAAMMSTRQAPVGDGWRKLAALVLVVVAVGLPVNDIAVYAPLAVAAVVILSGEVRAERKAWLAALGVVALALVARMWLAPPLIEEGHNVFLPGAQGEALRRGLPADVYARMAQEFDTRYPPEVRCRPSTKGCWQDGDGPQRSYAFSADGIWRKADASRSVTALDFSDPVWLRLGFINELAYNWYTTAPDVHRDDRDRRVFAGFARWRIAMPWFEMIRLPAAYVGGELCWRGDVLWEGEGERFAPLPAAGCRAIETADAGRRVFGLAVASATLAMDLKPPWRVQLLRGAQAAVIALAVIAVIAILLRVRWRPALLALLLIGLAVLVIAIDDASFLGGVRPFDGGDDGLFYDGIGRQILRHLLAGDFYEVLRGGESVFYYGGPGLRYFRALEHIVFGESYLGYLSLILAFPFLVLALFRRFLDEGWALALIILFVAVPVGVVFGTSFVQYQKWAARGFADPAAYTFFIAGVLPIVGTPRAGPRASFASGFFGALLLALSIFMRPVVAPAAGVLLAGAGIAALWQWQWPRLAGLCIGFLPFFVMPLHNWYFGDVFVLLSSNARDANLLVMPPSAYLEAFWQLLHLDFSGLARILGQFAKWLSGPAESYWTIPLNLAGVVIVVYVAARGKRFDRWLRLLAGAALAQHAVAFFYVGNVARYHLLSWLITLAVVMAYCREVAIPWLARRFPAPWQRVTAHPVVIRLASGLTRLQEMAA